MSPEECSSEQLISYRCICNQGYSGDGFDCQGERTTGPVTRPKPSPAGSVGVNLRLVELHTVYAIQPVVKSVEQPVEQPAASCKQTFSRLFNRFDRWFDNRLYRVNGVLGLVFGGKPSNGNGGISQCSG